MRGSAHFGFTLEWYREHQQFWVIRTLRMERLCAPRYQEALEISTWISSLARVRSDRNYLVQRVSDGRVMARGIANWVYVDARQMMPTRIHPDIAAMFDKQEQPALAPPGKLVLQNETPALFDWTTARRAQFYEADSAQHTNNAIYVDWLEEAVRDALRAMGYALALDGTAPLPWFYRHAIEYVRSAVPGDPVNLRARLVHRGNSLGEWELEATHASSGEQLLRAATTTVWVNAQNRIVPWKRAVRTH